MDEQESSKKREPLSAMEEERPSKVQKNEELTAPEEIDNRVIEYLYGMEEELLLKKMNFEQRMGIDDTLSIYRAKIVDVLALLSCRLGLDQDTLHTAFSYYDRYNSLNPVVDTDKLELIGVSSLYIAGKYEERAGMKQSFYFVQFMDSPIADGQILNMETEILGCLRYKLGYPTVKTFLRIFLDKVQKDYEEKNLQLEHMASYIADLSLVEHECCKFKPSLLASSIIFLIKFLIQPNSQPWSSTSEQRFRYMASDMKECVNILYELRSGKRHRTLEIREKYRRDQFLGVAKSPLPELSPSIFYDCLKDVGL
ncbi:G2/mitotic-specific cyclin C13-1-like isoform X2 [Populus nigra]|nr:G2/mitotic-specific cyclin C13-1-like isoform X2 [Populus nigra]XP_061985869.1 G2/mitotic-specific cyclin C13-1-like isoform X2 [Populus nigra]